MGDVPNGHDSCLRGSAENLLIGESESGPETFSFFVRHPIARYDPVNGAVQLSLPIVGVPNLTDTFLLSFQGVEQKRLRTLVTLVRRGCKQARTQTKNPVNMQEVPREKENYGTQKLDIKGCGANERYSDTGCENCCCKDSLVRARQDGVLTWMDQWPARPTALCPTSGTVASLRG